MQISEYQNTINSNTQYYNILEKLSLRDIEFIKDIYQNSFILVKPAIIKNGAFYFCIKKEDYLYTSIISYDVNDSNPVITNSFLYFQIRHAFSRYNDITAILHFIHKLISETYDHETRVKLLNEKVSIGICCLEIQQNILHYIDYNMPLWLIRNQIVQIEDSNPEEYFNDDLEGLPYINSRQFKLNPNDCFYMFSALDKSESGFNKSSNSHCNNFKNALNSFKHESIIDQEAFLNNHFSSSIESVGMVLIGFKI